jgi:AcrR family transcriptional regulator
VSTRQIAEVAGVAEGTIFGVFPDKDAVVQAVLQAALDPEPTERELAAIDRSLPFEDQHRRCGAHHAAPHAQHLAALIQHRRNRRTANSSDRLRRFGGPFRAEQKQLRTDPVTSARRLRALTFAVSNPAFFAGKPPTPREIVTLLLDGIRVRGRSRRQRGTGG